MKNIFIINYVCSKIYLIVIKSIPILLGILLFDLLILKNSILKSFVIILLIFLFIILIVIIMLFKLFGTIKSNIITKECNPKKYISLMNESARSELNKDLFLVNVIQPYYYIGEFNYLISLIDKNRNQSYLDSYFFSCLYFECLSYIFMKDKNNFILKYNELKLVAETAEVLYKKRISNIINQYLIDLQMFNEIVLKGKYIENYEYKLENKTNIQLIRQDYMHGLNSLNNFDKSKAIFFFSKIKDKNKDLFFVKDSLIILEFLVND